MIAILAEYDVKSTVPAYTPISYSCQYILPLTYEYRLLSTICCGIVL